MAGLSLRFLNALTTVRSVNAGYRSSLCSLLHFLTALANTEGHWMKEVSSRGRANLDRTDELNPLKAHYPQGVYTPQITKGLRAGSKLVQAKPALVATPNAKVFQESILLSKGQKMTCNSNNAKCCVRTG